MAVFLLIRHAETDFVGRTLCSWTPGVRLNRAGREQAEALAARLAGRGIEALYSSPLERATETADAIARRTGLPVLPCDAIGELRFGEWSGSAFAELQNDLRWRRFNSFRSGSRAPGGEFMLEGQLRIVAELLNLRDRHPRAPVALVSHSDVIKSAIAYFLGMSLDLAQRLVVSPASVSLLSVDEDNARLLALNYTGEALEW